MPRHDENVPVLTFVWWCLYMFVTKNWQQGFSVLRECNPSFCFVGYNIKINPSGGKQKTLTARNAMGANWERKLKKAGKTKRNPKQDKGKGGKRKRARKRNVRKERELSLRNQPPSWWWRGLLLLYFFIFFPLSTESLKIQCTSKKYKKQLTKKKTRNY